MKKTMSEILLHALASVMKIVKCEMGEYLKDCTCMKSLFTCIKSIVDDLVVTFDEIEELN